jgi:hypothetical protein
MSRGWTRVPPGWDTSSLGWPAVKERKGISIFARLGYVGASRICEDLTHKYYVCVLI